ncbi:MAG: PEP-CTERM sorting domain-containing protein [Chthoniobacterales bacterium]
MKMPSLGSYSFKFQRFAFALPALAGLLSLGSAFAQQPADGSYVNTPFVIANNQTQYTASTNDAANQIWVSFAGVFSNSGGANTQTIGSSTLESLGIVYNTSVFKSFNITALSAPVVGGVYVGGALQTGTNTPLPYFNGNDAYTFSLNGFSGRVYVNYGSTALTVAPTPGAPGTSPYIVFEPTVLGLTLNAPTSTTSNMDLSYVDGVSGPAATNMRNGTTGATLAATSNNPITANPNILANVAALVPTAAVIRDGTPANNIVRVMSSAASPGSYHDWTTLMTTLQTTTAAAPLAVSSFTAPTTGNPYNLSGTFYGYSGAGAVAGQPPGWQTAQAYTTGTAFVSDMSAGLSGDAQTALSSAFSPATGLGVSTAPGAVITSADGSYQIFIPQAQLNATTGIYGNNPGYIVMTKTLDPGSSPATYTYTTYNYAASGIQNDLGGRVVGDLVAGIVFGWSNSTVNIATNALNSSTDLYGATFTDAAMNPVTTIGGLSTGQYFYLLSLAAAEGKLSSWIGGNADPNAQDYDAYLAAVSEYTQAYASGFTDRLSGPGAPGSFWYTANPATDPYIPGGGTTFENIGFVEFDLGGTSPVPEPSTTALLVVGGVGAVFLARRKIAAIRA